jgi:hypothetical protein
LPRPNKRNNVDTSGPKGPLFLERQEKQCAVPEREFLYQAVIIGRIQFPRFKMAVVSAYPEHQKAYSRKISP